MRVISGRPVSADDVGEGARVGVGLVEGESLELWPESLNDVEPKVPPEREKRLSVSAAQPGEVWEATHVE